MKLIVPILIYYTVSGVSCRAAWGTVLPKSAADLRQYVEEKCVHLGEHQWSLPRYRAFITMSVLQAEHQKWKWDFSVGIWFLTLFYSLGLTKGLILQLKIQNSCPILKANCPQHYGRPKHAKEPLPILQNIQRKMIPQTLLKFISSVLLTFHLHAS